MRIRPHIQTVHQVLKVVVQILTPLAEVLAFREAEERFPGKLRQLWIFASEVAVQGVELREPLP